MSIDKLKGFKDVGQIERHLKFCEAFNIKIGSAIKVPGWFEYDVEASGFKVRGKGFKNDYSSQAYEIIVDRGFKQL